MIQKTLSKKRRILRGVLAGMLVLAILIIGAWLLLFRVNQFQLVLQLQGDAQVEIDQGETYRDAGVSAKLMGSLFFRDGLVVDAAVSTANLPDTSVPGEYEISYHGSFWKWEASASRRILVIDTQPPQITLKSIPGAYTIPGEVYQEEGYSAWDQVDGDLTDRVIREEKDGFVTYSVTDSAGNRTTVGRKIYYVDPIAPELTLLGENTIYIYSGAGYTEPGWVAQDNVDGDLSAFVKVEGRVDKYLAGTYQLCYSVKDSSGNITQCYRTVVVVPYNLPETVTPSGKVIYLTFDDGPGPYTRELLDLLDQYNATATFFVINSDHVELIREIVEEGHSIGIHSVTHTYREIYASADAFFNDLLTMQRIIYEKTGVKTYLMRFPGGSSNTVSSFNEGIMTYLTQAVEDMGFQYFDWNVDSDDAGRAKTAKKVFENVTSGVEKRRISIVLQHDIKDYSVEAIEKILQWGQENGYTFCGLDMTSPTAHHGVNN